jgi:hypothetical protein
MTDYYGCAECSLRFRSERDFNRHRVGKYPARGCLSSADCRAEGIKVIGPRKEESEMAKKAVAKKAPEVEGTRPRGFASAESKDKVKQALKMVGERYPAMGGEDVPNYLMEVGAGRILALYNFDQAKEAAAAKKGAKKGVKK